MNGEQSAYTWLVRSYQSRLQKLLEYRLGRYRCEAEDAVQETFAKAFRYLDRYDARYQFSTWLFTIGLRIAADMHRSRKRRPNLVTSSEAMDRYIGPTLHMADCDDGVGRLWEQAKNILSETQSTALWLRYAEDLSIGEIAIAMHKTQVGVRVLLHRARCLLMRSMDESNEQDVLDPLESPRT